MAQFVAFQPGVEVNGETVLSIVDGMGVFTDRGYRILADHGIRDPKPGQWYELQSYLNAFKAIFELTGEFTLFNIGKMIPRNAQFPPGIETIEQALSLIDVAYHMNHRIHGQPMFNPETGTMLEGIGHYTFTKTGDREGIFVCENPYPSDFDRGIAESMANRFRPDDSEYVILQLDLTKPTRKHGADSCTFNVRW